MYRLTMFVNMEECNMNRGIMWRRLHAFVLKAIQATDVILAQMIHDRKERQVFSIHPIVDQGEIRVQSSSRAMIQCLQEYLMKHQEVKLGEWKGFISEVETTRFCEEEAMEQFSKRFTLRFLSPTTFFQQGNYYPLPDPSLLFLSTLKIKQTGNIEFPYATIRKIIISNVKIKTEYVDFGKFKATGFTGSMTLNTQKLPVEEQKWVWKLASYGTFMGFGYKTAWGLGRTDLLPIRK